jgi:type II secretory pathway component PulF
MASQAEAFRAFNAQLAHLTQLGLPLEKGLRTLAGEMRRGKAHRQLETVAERLEAGQDLASALAG